MRIILQEDVEKLGHRGQVVEVAEGFARNYLLPRKLALQATEGNLKRLEQIRGHLAKRTASEKDLAQQLATSLSTATVTLARKAGETSQLFGSVTSADIAEALAAQGHTVDKRSIQLDEPIKVIGEYDVPVKLAHGVTGSVKVVVNREE
ncbi:MAG: 50S ribosomal protein L9 [Acidobacteria bacterium]|nr:50S ribosomal protein L9 [Acidobacteriota bacterium]MBI3663089.1 50S ribosomal protein L9 [Acidobacteriota bacterium]